jgi:hypothetical protein
MKRIKLFEEFSNPEMEFEKITGSNMSDPEKYMAVQDMFRNSIKLARDKELIDRIIAWTRDLKDMEGTKYETQKILKSKEYENRIEKFKKESLEKYGRDKINAAEFILRMKLEYPDLLEPSDKSIMEQFLSIYYVKNMTKFKDDFIDYTEDLKEYEEGKIGIIELVIRLSKDPSKGSKYFTDNKKEYSLLMALIDGTKLIYKEAEKSFDPQFGTV